LKPTQNHAPAVKPENAFAKMAAPAVVPPIPALVAIPARAVTIAAEMNPNSLSENLEHLKKLSLRFMIRKGLGLAEAEDLFQQSVLKALTTEATLQNKEKLQSWFMAILRNSLLDHFRSRALHQKKERLYQIEQEIAATDTELEQTFCQCVKGFLGEIPETDKALLEKHFLEGKTFAELSKTDGIAEGTLRVKSLRARERLKDMFKACCNVRKFEDLKDCGCE
jgi:RNA polymerase sigma-70 factor (ECF subfamily)